MVLYNVSDTNPKSKARRIRVRSGTPYYKQPPSSPLRFFCLFCVYFMWILIIGVFLVVPYVLYRTDVLNFNKINEENELSYASWLRNAYAN